MRNVFFIYLTVYLNEMINVRFDNCIPWRTLNLYQINLCTLVHINLYFYCYKLCEYLKLYFYGTSEIGSLGLLESKSEGLNLISLRTSHVSIITSLVRTLGCFGLSLRLNPQLNRTPVCITFKQVGVWPCTMKYVR